MLISGSSPFRSSTRGCRVRSSRIHVADTLKEQAEELIAAEGAILERGRPEQADYRRPAGVSCVSRFSPFRAVDDLDRLVDAEQFERIRVVVDVGDRLAGDLDDDVAFHQPRLLGGSAADDTRQQQSFHLCGVVGNGAGGDAHAREAGAAR